MNIKSTKKPSKVLRTTIYGTTNLGERGQIVIPKEARDKLKLKKGESFLVLEDCGCLSLIPSKIAAKLAEQITDLIKK